MTNNERSTKILILEKFLQLASKSNWSDETMKLAFLECQLSKSYLELIFENGISDLEEFFIEEKIILTIENEAEGEKYKSLTRISERIEHLLLSVFMTLQNSNRDALLAFEKSILNSSNLTFLSPISAIKTSRIFGYCYKISDKIWQNAGDSSTDLNYYSKRLILSKIVLHGFYSFFNDDSQELNKVCESISENLSRVMKFSQFKRKITSAAERCIEFSKIEFLKDKESNFKKFMNSTPFLRLIPSIKSKI